MADSAALKAQGNELFAAQKFKQAVEVYTKAIEASGEAVEAALYRCAGRFEAFCCICALLALVSPKIPATPNNNHSNRSVAFLSMKDVQRALDDAEQVGSC